MKIEIDAKELAALIGYLREQRDHVGDADDLAKEIVKRLPDKIISQVNRRI